MATTETSGAAAPRHPEEDDSEIFARLARFDELHLRVGADPGIGSVTIVLEGMPGTANADLTLAPRHALSLALALVGAVGRPSATGARAMTASVADPDGTPSPHVDFN